MLAVRVQAQLTVCMYCAGILKKFFHWREVHPMYCTLGQIFCEMWRFIELFVRYYFCSIPSLQTKTTKEASLHSKEHNKETASWSQTRIMLNS